MFDTKNTENKFTEAHERFIQDLGTIQTGRASIAILDNVMVDSYGTKTPLNQVASIKIEDPKTIRISPWDKTQIPGIERAISIADLGISTAADDDGVRVIIPDMTTDRREQIAKTAEKKMEEGKIRVRQVREEAMNEIKALELSDDEKRVFQDQVQEMVKKANTGIEASTEIKKDEILNI
jgi:ribosome recycling factor